MYIVTRIPQIDGDIRFVGASTRQAQKSAQRTIAGDAAMVDYIKGLVARDCKPGKRPAGWVD